MGRSSQCQGSGRPRGPRPLTPLLVAAPLLALVAAGVLPTAIAYAQVFIASRPQPEFMVGPLFVRASVTPALGDVPIDVFFSLSVPAGRTATDIEQDLYLLWPGAVVRDQAAGRADPRLARQVEALGFDVIDQGRLPLFARNLYGTGGGRGGRPSEEPIAGNAAFVTFVRTGGTLGLTAPATWIRIPWDPRLVNRAFIIDLRLRARDLFKDKPGTWIEHTLWGRRHRLALGFNDVRNRAVFPLYFLNRDRVVRLSEDPSQVIVNFAAAHRLKIDEMAPPSIRRERSESLEDTEVLSLFLDRGEGITPQVLTVQFGYFSGLQSWAPVLIPIVFFALGNLAGPLVRGLVRHGARVVSARIHVAMNPKARAGRESGVIVSRGDLGRIVPGETTYEEVLRICGDQPEEQERLSDPDRKRLVYRGRRLVPHRRRSFGWLATVDRWDAEHHEVEIELERGVVRDIQATVRRTPLAQPA